MHKRWKQKLALVFLSLILVMQVLAFINLNIFPSIPRAYALGENWLTGWTYRKQHNITGVMGAGTNYCVNITVMRSSGSDSGSTVYVGTNCNNDFSDIRFTDDDGNTTLSAWNMTQYNGANITCWLEVADSLNSNQTIYVYYGNAGASAYWDGEATFNDRFTGLFDDFSRRKWANVTVENAYGGDIIKNGSTYYMYYRNSTNYHVYRANSTDLRTWTTQEMVIDSMRAPSILKNCTLGNVVALPYMEKYWAIARNGTTRLDLFSANNLTVSAWTYEKNVIQIGSGPVWDNTSINIPSFFLNGSTYYCYYHGGNGINYSVGFATSNAPNGTWTKSLNNPRLWATEAWEDSDVLDPVCRISQDGSQAILYYTGDAGGNAYATSSNFNGTWTKQNRVTMDFSYPIVNLAPDGAWILNFDGLTNNPYRKGWVSSSVPYGNKNFNSTWIHSGNPNDPSGGYLTLLREDPTNKYVFSDAMDELIGMNHTLVFRANMSLPLGGGTYGTGSSLHGLNDNIDLTAPYEVFSQRQNYAQLYTLSTTSGYSANLSQTYSNDFYIFEIQRNATMQRFLVNGTIVRNESSPSQANLGVMLGSRSEDAQIVLDWIFVRPYVDPEPSHGTWGNEESTGGETPTLTIHKPENTTYTSGTIPVNMTATGGTIDTYLYDVWNISASAWVYPSNQTYTTPANMSGYYANGTFRFHGWANNTDGNWDEKNVTYTVATPPLVLTIHKPENTTYTVGEIPVNMSATGGDPVDKYRFSIWNITALEWVEINTPYTTPTTTTGYVNGTYRFFGIVNNTIGETVTENVTYTVAIPSGPQTPTLTIHKPQNTTYTTGTIPVNMTATGGTIDIYLYNTWNISASAWVYPSNQTYTTPTSISGYVNGTFRFHGWVNNTDGNWDHKNVTFTVAIPENVVIEINEITPASSRVSVNVQVYIYWHCRFSSNSSSCTTGTLYINASGYAINGTGWATTGFTSSSVVLRIYTVTGVNVNGETDYNQTASNPQVIWDKARIYYQALDDSRVNINVNIEFRVRGLLLYDNHALGSGDTVTANFGALAWDAGNSWFDGTRSQGTVGAYVFQISSLTEDTYSITAFEVNVTNPTGIWDRLTVTISASDTTPLNNTDVTVSWTIRRQYDSSTVSSFTIDIDRNASLYGDDLTNSSIIQNYADTTYNYTSSAVTDSTYGITAFQTNTVTVTWSSSPGFEIPEFSVPSIMQFWYEGDFFGFFQSLFADVFTSVDVFYAFLAFLISMAIYIRTRSLILLTILSFLVLGSGLMLAMPLASGLGVLLMIFGVAGLLHKLYASR